MPVSPATTTPTISVVIRVLWSCSNPVGRRSRRGLLGHCVDLQTAPTQESHQLWAEASGPSAELINPLPKCVASRTLTGPLTWNAELLGPDTAAAVAAVKEQHAGSLISYGCGALAAFLARSGLVDEVRFWLHPVVFGDGVRPFHEGELPIRLRLITATPYSSGVMKLSYQPLAG